MSSASAAISLQLKKPLAEHPIRERRPASRRLEGRSGRAVSSAARKLTLQSGKRYFKKSRSHPWHQNSSELRQMITGIHTTTDHGIRQICIALSVPCSNYYHAAHPTASQLTGGHLEDLITEIFKSHRHRRRYGYRRIQSEVMDQNITCAPDIVRRIMTERHLKAIQPKSYIPKTSNGRADKSSDNLLLGQPHPEQSNQVWAGDITHISTSTGWLYLAVVIDLCSRKIVGWAQQITCATS